MKYWRGFMNWPLNPDWKCETCGEYHGLTWGLAHGECRCNNCHTVYHMRPGEKILYIPFCCLKKEYKLPAKVGYELFKTPIDTWDDEAWDKAIAKAKGDL